MILVVAAALIDARGDVLVQQRPPESAFGGLWEFPGGKIEPGETPEAALVRELREELAIVVAPSALIPLAFVTEPLEEEHLLLLLFQCRTWRKSPQPLHATALRWLAPVELFHLPMPPADRPLVAQLIASGQ